MATEHEIIITGNTKQAQKAIEDLDEKVKDLGQTVDKTKKKKDDSFSEDASIKIRKQSRAVQELDQHTEGLGSKFIAVGKAAKKGGAAMKSALIQSGIGIAVVLMGLIVANWDKISDFVRGVNHDLEDQLELNKKNQAIIKERLETNKLLEKLAISEGKETKTIIEDKKKLLLLELDLVAAGITNIANQKAALRARAIELSFAQKTLNLIRLSQGQPIKIFNGYTDEEKAQIEQLDKDLVNLGQRAIQIRTTLNNLDKPIEEKRTGGKPKRVEKISTEQIKTKEEILEDPEVINARLRGIVKEQEIRTSESNILQFKQEIREEDLENQKAAAAKQREIDKIAFRQKIQTLQAVSGAVSAAGDLLGKETAAGKALAVAASLINTYTGIAASLKIGGPLGIAQAIATGLVGFKAVKDIIKVKVPGGRGSGEAAGASAETPVAPQFNVVGSSATNQLAESISQQQNEPIKAFVVSKDISNQQELDRNTESTATFG